MKIIEIIPQLSSGGAERFVVDLCNELSVRHEVILVVLHNLKGNNFYLNELQPNVKVVSMNKRKGVDLLLPFRLMNFIRKEQPDVVHTHLRSVMYAGLSTAVNSRIMHCHTVHTTADKEAGSFVSRSIRRVLFKHHLAIPVTISEESRRSFVDFYGMDAPMIDNGRNVPSDLVVSDAVADELKQYKRTEQTRLLVCLARIDPVKRQALLAKVSARLLADGYDFSVLAVGSTKSQYVEEVKLNAGSNFFMLGERKNPLEYLKAAGAYVLCSSYEGMPISLIEALGVGAIPICTPVGGIINVVKDGDNGFLAADLSEEALYDVLKSFLQMKKVELEAMRRKAIESYKPYSMVECAEKYEKLFNAKSLKAEN